MLSGRLDPLTAGQAAASWRADPVGIVLAVLLAAGYLAAVRQVVARGSQWPISRTLTFLIGGVGSLLLTTCSFLGAYAPGLRWVAVIQAGLLLLVCPLLLGLGSPVALLTSAWGRRATTEPGTTTAGPLRRATFLVLRLLNAPGVGALVMIIVLSLLVFTPWLGWAQQGTGQRAVTVVALLAAGLPLALPVTDRGAELSSTAYAAMMGLGLIEFLLDAVPGMALRLDSHVVAAGHWLAVRPAWAPSPLTDQHLAGDWLWFFAEAGDLPFLIILILAWIRSDAREAAAQDAALDELELELGQPGEPGMMRPWWQTADEDPGPRRR